MASKREKKRKAARKTGAQSASVPALRGKVWVEIDRLAAMTDAGADLLEQISIHGSVSEAARRLHFSYRRAWMLVDAMNRRWPGPLVSKSIGGTHGGGAKLTELGDLALRNFRDLQLRLEHLLDETTEDFRRATSAQH